MEQGRAEACESGVKSTVRDWQPGTISFEKTLGTTAVSTWGTLTLPAKLWRHHGDMVQKLVTLQPVADRKTWTVNVKIYFPGQRRTQVLLCGGWSLFVGDNGLGIGDRLKFTLTERSKFEVVMLRKGGRDPKVTSVLRPKIMSKDSELSQAKKLVASLQHANATNQCKVKSVREMDSMSLQGEIIAAKDGIAHSVLNITCEGSSKSASDVDSRFFEALEIPSDMDSRFFEPSKSPSDMDSHCFEGSEAPSDMDSIFFESSETPSDMDSHFFEPMLQKNQQENGALFIHPGYHAQSQNALPWFCKRIRGSNALEIPCNFLRLHWTQIGTHAQLQGIHETSRLHTVKFTCVVDHGRPRLFFKSRCWNSFVHENCLRVGHKVLFTLIGHSTFAVRISE